MKLLICETETIIYQLCLKELSLKLGKYNRNVMFLLFIFVLWLLIYV